MKPILYAHDETSFTSAGLAILSDCISFTVEEELNGTFEAEFQYPITGRHYDLIQEGLIVGATHDDSGVLQPFEIYKRSAPIDGKVTFNAHHISYRLSKEVVMPFTATSLAGALTSIAANIVGGTEFSFSTDMAAAGELKVETPSAVRAILGGEENTLLQVYGGEFEFDKFDVILHTERGTTTDVEIRYGKNLSDLTQEIDESETYNAIVPFWKDSSGSTLVTLPEVYIAHDADAELTMMPLDLTDQFNKKPTVTQLRDKAQEKLDAGKPWTPSESIEVNFVALWQTDEYERYAELQRVHLGDSVSVYYPALGVIANAQRVVKTVYNTLLDRYDEITLNELKETLADMNDQSIATGMNTAISDAVKLTIDSIKANQSGTVTTDANGVANINSLTSGTPFDGTVSGREAYITFGNASGGARTARFINADGTPIASASLNVTIYSIL